MVIIIAEPLDFDQEFNKHNGLVLALFTGSKNASTGKSWCGDCVRAEPLIEAAIAAHPDTVLLYCEVGPSESWRNQPGHPYRIMASTQVRCVPTLIRYQNQREIARLEEGQLLDQGILDEIFS